MPNFIKFENIQGCNIGVKQLLQEGLIVYEYNPLKVLRTNNSAFKNAIVDLDTEKLNFDLQHPVDIITLPSYDGSVNLILNDGKNPPKLINSRFTTTGLGTYKIVDRFGDNETNIYDEETFESEASLFKTHLSIIKLDFLGLQESGNLKVGNYHFYFKLRDADGNETDFVSESGVVSCFIGNTDDISSIRGGIEDESTYKSAVFKLKNISSEYSSVSVYYTRSSSSLSGMQATTAYHIELYYPIIGNTCNIIITGFEPQLEISTDELNFYYHTLESAKTQIDNSSMLFLGNTTDTTIDYKELTDLSLRFTPSLYYSEDIGCLDYNYKDISNSKNKNEYYNPLNIYYRLGYWDDEIYRFGVVYIFKNGDLSPVFNVRGIDLLTKDTTFEDYPLRDKDIRTYIPINEYSFTLKGGENIKGVVKIRYTETFKGNLTKPCGIKFSASEEVKKELEKLNILGLFFVRLKRMKSTLCLAIPIGFEPNSRIPMLPYKDGGSTKYMYESFISSKRILTHSFEARQRSVPVSSINIGHAALCPEYELDKQFLNNFFTGSDLKVELKYSANNSYFNVDPNHNNHYYLGNVTYLDDTSLKDMSIIGVPDGTKYTSNKEQLYSAMPGDLADATKFQYVEYDNKITSATNIVRGVMGTYIGLESPHYTELGIVNIKIPGYDPKVDYFDIRFKDKSPFFAISDRLSLNDFTLKDEIISSPGIYRGDCFICNFSHRMIRNFSDTETPINDVIIDEDCWKDHYSVGKEDSEEELTKINRSDVNAVKIGHWATFKICSNYNLSLRSHDNSYPSEYGLTGHYRSFYPYSGLDVSGTAKIPESQVRNAGYDKTVSEQNRFELEIVPAIKNTFHTRIYYSDVSVNSSFRNGYRVFKNAHYKDYPLEYGSLIRLMSWSNNLIAIFEHGILLLPVNEKATITSVLGETSFLLASSVLPEPTVLSDLFGSQWAESIIQTPYAIYGVDTVAKKIWRLSIKGTLQRRFTVETISDFKLLKFLNDNITLKEHENIPIIGVRNVKSHYNAFKNDVMFTFYDDLNSVEEKVWNLCFNEATDKFTTFYSWVPSYSANIDNIFFTFDRDVSKRVAKKFGSNQTIESSKYTLPSLLYGDITLLSELSVNLHPFEAVNGTNTLTLDISVTYEILDSVYSTMFEIYDNKLYLNNKVYTNFNKSGRITKEAVILPIKATVTNSINDPNSTNEGVHVYEYYNNLHFTHPNYDVNLEKSYFWKHGLAGLMELKQDIKPCLWYDKLHPFEFEFIVVGNPSVHKIFTNLSIIANKATPESFHFEIDGDVYNFADDKKNMFFRQEALKHIYQYNGCDISFNRNYLSLIPEQRDIPFSNSVYKDKSTSFPIYYGRVDTINEIEDFYQSKSDFGKDYQKMSGSEIVYDKSMNTFRIATHIKGNQFGKLYMRTIHPDVYLANSKYPNFKCSANITYVLTLPNKTEIRKSSTLEEFINLVNNSNWIKTNEGYISSYNGATITNIEGFYEVCTYGRLNGNMAYNEGIWQVQIPSIVYMLKNEPTWETKSDTGIIYPSLNLVNNPTPNNEVLRDVVLPKSLLNLGYTADKFTNWADFSIWENRKETRLRDKYIKVKIRYTGDDLAVIYAIKTMFTISYV